MSSSSSSVPISAAGGPGSVAPTPQNTPLTTAPLATALSKPTVPTIGEEDGEAESGPPDTPPAAARASALAGLGPKGHNAILGLVQQRLQGIIGQSSGYVEGLPIATKKRVVALKGLQSDHERLFFEYKKETLQLEKKYAALYKPLFDRRLEIIEGKALPTPEELQKGHDQDIKDRDELLEEEEEEEDADTISLLPHEPIVDTDEGAKEGVPQFWLTALRNHAGLSDLITERDEAALAHLRDIKLEHLDIADGSPKMGFKFIFEFTPNPFFEETVLTKTYYYLDELTYEGDFIFDGAVGTEITWKADQDLTKEVEIKKQRNKHTNKTRVVKKARKVPSFFDFFSPPQPPTKEQEASYDEEELAELEGNLELDYQIGEDLKDRVIPRAIDYFTGKALRHEMDDDDYSDDGLDDDDDDEDDDDDDLDDDDEDEIPRRKGKPAPPKGAKAASGDQECKQQ